VVLEDVRLDVAAEQELFVIELGQVVWDGTQRVGEPPALGVEDDQGDERGEVAQVGTGTAQREGRDEQDEEHALGGQREAEHRDRRGEGDGEPAEREQRRSALDSAYRWTPLVAGAGVALSVALRFPFWSAPLTTDEGGYAEVARRWQHGETLYGAAWVDRPQGLILVFWSLLHLGLDSPYALRVAAAGAAALVTLATLAVALRVAGRIAGYAAAALMATFGASPYIESFTLSGELLASLPAVLSLLAFTQYVRSSRSRWLVLCGVLAGCALMVRQSAFDAALAAVAYLLITQGRRALPKVGLIVGGAALPVAAGIIAARDPSEWSAAVIAYRWRGDSILTGSFMYRLGLFGDSMPAAAYALALLALLAAIGWGRAPLLARLWLAAALVGVVGGGNFHYHYYIQLVPPLCILGGVGVVRLLQERRRMLVLAAGAVAAATIALTAPTWFESGRAQARAIWPHDPHLVHDAAIARYVRANTRPHDKIFVIWGAASIYYLADREPALRYMWLRNIQSLPGVLERARRVLLLRKAKLVVVVQDPGRIDKAGVTARILRERYERVVWIDGVPIYRPRR